MKFKFILFCLLLPVVAGAQTSWKGTTSTAWGTAANWTAGVPTAALDAIIGDTNFTGANQPAISATAVCKSLTIGTGAKVCTLTVPKTLTISGNVTIGANGTLSHSAGVTISLTGNWTNSGAYLYSNNNANVTFAGTSQIIGGSTATVFRKITVNTGSTATLAVNISVVSQLTVNGTVDPNESSTYLISGAGKLVVNSGGKLRVRAATFAGNFAQSGTKTLNAGSTVEYAAAGDQTVANTLTYSTLTVSGSGNKALAGNLPALVSSVTSAGNINVNAATLDLATFTAARGTTTVGGTFTLASGARLRIGGTNTFPANYATRSLHQASTVEYYGTNQTVSLQSYGHLTLSSSGAATKIMPTNSMTIAGNLTSATNAGGASVLFTNGAALTVNGDALIGAASTFNGGSFTNTFGADWTNNGTFAGATGTVIFSGAGGSLAGTGTNNFNHLSVTGAGVTAATNTSLAVSDNLATSGAGTFTHVAGGAGTLTMNGSSKTVSGTGISLNHLTVPGSVSSASSLTVAGDLDVGGSFSASAGTITLSGTAKVIRGAGSIAFNALNATGTISATNNFSLASDLSVSGTFTATAGTATFNGTSALSGAASLFNVTLNGTSLQLGSSAVLGVAGAFTLTAGAFNVTISTPNTVSYNGAAQTVPSATYDNLTLAGSGIKTAGGALTVNRDFTIGSGTTFGAGAFTHSLYGNWVNNGAFTAGTSTLQLLGGLNASLSGATTFNSLTVNKSSSVNVVTLNTNVTAATVNMTSGQINTGTNGLTLTTTRTGSGTILGTLTRTHAFASGTAYAFESPYNTVTFASLGTVSSVTVTAASGAVGDFPFGGSANRQYTLGLAASGAYNATLRLHYEDTELNGNTESSMQLWRYGSAWAASGKTANDTANNWVEQSALTNITGRWMLSDDNNVARWNGSASTAWENAANWTAAQGGPSLPPSTNDIVELGTVAFTYPPTIGSAASAKSVTFGSAQAVTLTLGASGSLLTIGNINGSWTNNATHTLSVGSQSLTVGGDLSLSDGTNNHAINLSASTGTVAISGSLTESGGANVTFTGAGTLSIGADFNYASGTFTPGSSGVTYNGSGAQIVGGVTYNHLSFNKAGGTATLPGSATVNGNLTLTNAGTFQVNAPLTVSGNVVINTGTTLNAGSVTISVGGDWTRGGTFTPGSGTVALNGSGAQAVGTSTFNDLTVNKSTGTATLTGNFTLNGDLNVSVGTLDLAGFSANRSAAGGTLTLAGGTTLKIGASFPANFNTRTLAASSTVEYTGSGTQTVSAETYGHLVFSNGGSNAKTLAGTAAAAGDLVINSGATFAASSFSLGVSGHWTNSGTFTASTSAVTLSGTAKTLSGTTTFNTLTVGGSYTALNNITVNGVMTVNVSGTYAAGATTCTLAGDFVNNGTLTSSGTVTFAGSGPQSLTLNSGFTSSGTVNYNGSVAPTLGSLTAPVLWDVNVNNTAGVTPLAGWTINGNFAIAAGATFTGGNLTHLFKGNFTNNGSVTSSGGLTFSPTNAVTLMLRGTAFASGGTVTFGGTGQITVAGGAPSFDTVVIDNTHAAGVTPNANWTLGGDLNISAGATFNGGSGLTHTISGSISDNGVLNGGTSTVLLNGNTEISGVGATTFNNLTVSGAVTNLADIAISGNFTNNGVFDATGFDVTFTGGGASVLAGSTTPTPIDSLVIAKTSATVTLAVNVNSISALTISSGTLDSATFTLAENAGTLSIAAGGTLKLGGTSPLPTFTTYIFDPAGTVEFGGTGTQVIAAQNYGSLKSSSTGARTLPSGGTVGIAGTFTPGANTFTNTGSTINFNGDGAQTIPAFNYLHLISSSSGARTLAASGTIGVAGTFTPGANSYTVTGSTMNFNGAAQTIPAFTYGNLTTSGSGAKTLGGNVTASGALSLNAGTLADAGFTATVNGDLASTVAHTGTGKILLSGGITNHVVSGGGTFSKLELNDAQGALLSLTNLTVTNTLTLTAGRITTSTNKVIIGTNGIVSRTNGYVAGWLQKPVATGAPTVNFEVGGPGSYAPVSLIFSNVTAAAAVIAQTVGTDHPGVTNAPVNPNKSANRYWSITNSGGTFSSYKATFEFMAADLDAGANPTNFVGGKLNGTNWTSPAILARSATNLQTASLTNYGDFQVGEIANVAPVAVADVVTRAAGISGFKILTTDLLANDTDANGDTLSLTSVTNLSVRGAAVELFGSWVFYTPSSAINTNDSFTYTISDGQGGTAVGTVSVNIAATTQARQLTSGTPGSGSFYGVLNSAYTVEYSTNLTAWLTLTNVTTSTNGFGAFTDPAPLSPMRFYRIVYP